MKKQYPLCARHVVEQLEKLGFKATLVGDEGCPFALAIAHDSFKCGVVLGEDVLNSKPTVTEKVALVISEYISAITQ